MLYIKKLVICDEYDSTINKLEHIKLEKAIPLLIQIQKQHAGKKSLLKKLDDDFKELWGID